MAYSVGGKLNHITKVVDELHANARRVEDKVDFAREDIMANL
mgnify:FL=1